MGGNRNQTTTTQVSRNPWAPQETEIQNLYSRANTALGQMPTGPNQTQMTAMNWLRDIAPQLSRGANELQDLGVRTARGDFLDPNSNPWIQGAVEAAQRPLRQQLDSNILAIGDAAQLVGAYGGDRERLLRGQALGDFNRAALDVANTTYFQNYNNERDRQQNAPALLGAAGTLLAAPGQLLGTLGDQEYQWAADMPWVGLDRMAQILGLGQQYYTGTDTVTQPGQSRGAGALSGALGGASAGGAFGPWGAGIGAVLGGLGGLFS